MPLSLSNRDQNSGHLFYNRRLRAATTRFSVRMKHDDRKQTAALALSMVLVAIAAGWMMLLNVLKPTGIVGDSAIIGDRDSGALYARIDGRLYPALNLTSARLATGTAGQSWRRGVVDIFVTWTPTATKSRRRCVRNVNGRTPCIRTHPDWAPSLAVRGCGSVAAATSTS